MSIPDIEIYGFILNTCHDTAKRAETRVGFPLYSPHSDDWLSPNFHRFVISYLTHNCDVILLLNRSIILHEWRDGYNYSPIMQTGETVIIKLRNKVKDVNDAIDHIVLNTG